MDNKGFTLIEIVVTVAILLAVSVIAVPNIVNITSKNKAKQHERIKETIIIAKNTYCDFNSCSSGVTIQKLIDEKLIDKESIEEFIKIDTCTILEDEEELSNSCIK